VGPRGDGLIAATEAGDRLGVSGSMVAYWFRQGLIVGQQRRPRTALWVRLTEADRQRWDGSAQRQENMIPLPEVSQALGLSPEQMKTEVQAGRLLTYRLRVKNRWRWYVQVAA
jgi:DNA-binding transcriptional MerR regulator